MISTDDSILENVRLAAGCGAGSTMLLSVALASMGDADVPAALGKLGKLGDRIAGLAASVESPHRRLAELEPELREEPEVGRMRLDIDDHELRGRLLFGELLGQRSFLQVAALAVAGVELCEEDAELLGHLGVVTQLADPRIWPLAITRRIAYRGGSLAQAVVAGLACLCTEQMTAPPVAGFMRFLDRMERVVDAGGELESEIQATLSRGERIPGVGRPVLRGDERVPRQMALAARYGKTDGPSFLLARRIDNELLRSKGARVNSAGFHGALLRDMGFAPDTGAAFSLLYFLVPLLAHAAAGARITPADSASVRAPRRAGAPSDAALA